MINFMVVKARAAPSDGQIYGVVRLDGLSRIHRIAGMCTEFTAKPDFRDLKPGDVFFYGTEGEFGGNYRVTDKAVRLIGELFPQFRVRTYMPNTNAGVSAHHFARIPLKYLDLATEQIEIVRELSDCALREMGTEIPPRHKIPPKETQRHRHTMVITQFNLVFPEDLQRKALKAGYFYEYSRRRKIRA